MARSDFDEYKDDLIEKMESTTDKSKREIMYEELEDGTIRELLKESLNREPTDGEVAEQKMEFIKLKYLVDRWEEEFFEKIQNEKTDNKKSP